MRKERDNWLRSKKLKRLLHRQKDPRREEPLRSLDGSLMEPRDVSNKAPCQGLTGRGGDHYLPEKMERTKLVSVMYYRELY